MQVHIVKAQIGLKSILMGLLSFSFFIFILIYFLHVNGFGIFEINLSKYDILHLLSIFFLSKIRFKLNHLENGGS